jgi:hypothetical protein
MTREESAGELLAIEEAMHCPSAQEGQSHAAVLPLRGLMQVLKLQRYRQQQYRAPVANEANQDGRTRRKDCGDSQREKGALTSQKRRIDLQERNESAQVERMECAHIDTVPVLLRAENRWTSV